MTRLREDRAHRNSVPVKEKKARRFEAQGIRRVRSGRVRRQRGQREIDSMCSSLLLLEVDLGGLRRCQQMVMIFAITIGYLIQYMHFQPFQWYCWSSSSRGVQVGVGLPEEAAEEMRVFLDQTFAVWVRVWGPAPQQ
ncbi:hypothetical protein AXG93_209s1250 [Marchantia polymorpha subsp. ruderalis]|uniref:Uncharacterized protein n=1 Tax=Marchantia polymorpha subsp. ruderalis TaxID=1480154 RepID=A0A176VIG1_MARPO|nr:hypothetical protein AXG93_209s1250 [Marchantia polymorpha subsp. ruderalis]